MFTGVQFTGALAANASNRWFTTTPRSGAPELDWEVAVERADASKVTYWITVKNLTNAQVSFDARYVVLNT